MGIPPRPSGTHGDQLRTPAEGSDKEDRTPQGAERLLLPVLAAGMTLTRGLGYYRECLTTVVGSGRD